MTPFDLQILTPRQTVYKGSVDMIIAPGEEGDFGILARHAPMIVRLRPGSIRIHQKGVITQQIFIEKGWANIAENECLLLVQEITS